MNRKQCLAIVERINDLNAIRAIIADVAKGEQKRGTWACFAQKLLKWVDNGMTGIPPFSVIRVDGNKKLPFFAFSSLAIADCPGKGECKRYCYSLKAWRFPNAFFRQLQNSLLMRHNPQAIAAAWSQIPNGKTVRLFVDGDFPSVAILRFFMDLCKARPDLSVYGYSKSWAEFVSLDSSGYVWPSNYLVNKSNGSRWINTGIANAFSRLPVVRGEFDAVAVAKSFITSKAYQSKDNAGSTEYRKDSSREIAGNLCPSFCLPGQLRKLLAWRPSRMRFKRLCGRRDWYWNPRLKLLSSN
jgi:hypothetical protein